MALQRIYIALGSNVGNRIGWLQQAVDGFHTVAESLRTSPVYESPAHTLIANEVQADYLNAVLELETSMPGEELLQACLCLERAAGRKRQRRYAPRTLDVDILTIGTTTYKSAILELPHPRLHLRRFVLQPWADLAPEWYIAGQLQATVASLLAVCTDMNQPVKTDWSLSNIATADV